MSRNPFLISLEEEMDKLIIETSSSADVEFYKAIKKIINLQLNEVDVINRFDEFSDTVIAIAKMDFSKRMSFSNDKDFFGHIAISLNMLSEELQFTAVPVNYLDDLLEALPQAAVVTDEKNRIRSMNLAFEELSGYEKKDLIHQPLSDLIGINLTDQNMNEGLSYFKQFKKQKQLAPIHTTLTDKNGITRQAEINVRFTGSKHLDPNGIIYLIDILQS